MEHESCENVFKRITRFLPMSHQEIKREKVVCALGFVRLYGLLD